MAASSKESNPTVKSIVTSKDGRLVESPRRVSPKNKDRSPEADGSTTAEVASGQPKIRVNVSKFGTKVGIVAAALSGIVGALSAIVTTTFLIKPNLAPSTSNSASITDVVLEPSVTLQEYFSHLTIKSSLQRLQDSFPARTRVLLEKDRSRLNTVGTVVHFGIQVVGLRGVSIGGRWSLFDGNSGRRLGESEALDPLPLSFRIEKRDSDTGSWEAWIDTSSFSPQRFFVRVELFDERFNTRIVFKDSAIFGGPA
ncbi:MAG: hypothetical protein JWM17_915 [Actinobacteria bacterium]|nr:hypothetical protein [Actinomycetota bacterium]